MKNKKTVAVVILLLLTFVYPLLGLIGCILMWRWTTWKKWIKWLITAWFILPVVFFVTYVFFFRPFAINGDAMHPTLKDKEYVLTNLINLRFANPSRKDIVVFVAPPDPKKDFIKRVIGLPGDTVMLQNGRVYLNGQLQNESKYLNSDVKTYGGDFLKDNQTITVPQDQYFVLGDNRQYSSDSREWGFVPAKNIIGTVMFCYWNCH